mgnify:CR=1 FL=1
MCSSDLSREGGARPGCAVAGHRAPAHDAARIDPDGGSRVGRTAGSRYDAIVIGSGAGGAPVAWSLARRGLRVAIVEAGGLLRADRASDDRCLSEVFCWREIFRDALEDGIGIGIPHPLRGRAEEERQLIDSLRRQ